MNTPILMKSCFLSFVSFLDALASLEPTQVGRLVGDSFKLWAIGAPL